MSGQLKDSKSQKLKFCKNYLENLIEIETFLEKKEVSKDLICLDPNCNLLVFNDFQYFLAEECLTKLFYFNKKNVHEILYNEEEFITINSNEKTKSLYYMFYLVLLINDKRDLINYKYSFDYIEDIFELMKKEKKPLKQLIISKILFELINNYKGIYDYEKDEAEKSNQIKNSCEEKINDNLKYLNEIGLKIDIDALKNKTIDEIYSEIIIWLIMNLFNNKFKDFDFVYNIIEQLDLKFINITNIMFKELLNMFNNNNVKFMQNYELSEIKDLSDNTKINFYYILFKYILKNSIYIYHIPFLLKNRKNIISIIKNSSEISSLIDEQLYLILNTFDILFYINSKNEDSKNRIDISLNSTFFSSNKKYNFKKEFENEIWFKILTKSSFKIEIKKTLNEFIINYKIKYLKNDNLYEIINYVNIFEIENNTKTNYFNEYLKFLNFLKKIENDLNILKEYNNFTIKFKMEFKTIFHDAILDTNCKYKLYKTEYFDDLISEDKNILNNQNKSYNGFEFLMTEIKKKMEISSDNKYNKYLQLKLKKKICQHKESAEFIKELNNGLYISGSTDLKLNIYDKINEEKIDLELPFYNQYDENIGEIYENKNSNQIIVCSENNIFLIEINKNQNSFNYKIYHKQINDQFFRQCIKIKDDSYIIIGKGITHIKDIYSLMINKEENINKSTKYIDKYYNIGIKINENIVAISSNRVYKNGEDNLIFYNFEQNKIIHEIKGFSFINSLNGLSLITVKNNINYDKILFCACQKYESNQKNGILLVEPELKDNENIYYEFYETDFEVHCFCQIKELINEKINKKEAIIESRYFLVGGFDEDKGIGDIYLYKIIYDKEISHSKIELIGNVKYEEEFDLNSINCIIQSKKTDDILISCIDGNVYSFKFND